MEIILTIVIILLLISVPYFIGTYAKKLSGNNLFGGWIDGALILLCLGVGIAFLVMCIDIAHQVALKLSPHLQTLINNLNQPL